MLFEDRTDIKQQDLNQTEDNYFYQWTDIKYDQFGQQCLTEASAKYHAFVFFLTATYFGVST